MHDTKSNVKKQAKSSFQTPPLFLNSLKSYNSTTLFINLTNYDSPPLFSYNLTNYNSSEVKN